MKVEPYYHYPQKEITEISPSMLKLRHTIDPQWDPHQEWAPLLYFVLATLYMQFTIDI